MSDVFEATDEESQTSVAVKIVRSAEAGLARRLAQEVRALSMLEHPGLVRLLDTGVAGGQAYLVMELVTGSTLAESLSSGPFGPSRTADIGIQLARALAYVHGRGIVHRDVKPSNILMGADGAARLGDFGIARLTDASTLTLAGTTLGTAAYMAPEQLEDHQVGPAADVWSLGIVLLECLTGRRVYEGSPGEVVARRLAGPVPLPGNLPVAWRMLLSGMLDHRPEERLTADDVAALLATSPFRQPWVAADPDVPGMAPPAALDLTALAPGSPATALLEGAMDGVARPPSAPGPKRHKGRWLALLVGLVLAALVVGLLLALGSNPPSTHHAGGSRAADRPHTSTTVAPTTTTTPPTTTTTTTTIAQLLERPRHAARRRRLIRVCGDHRPRIGASNLQPGRAGGDRRRGGEAEPGRQRPPAGGDRPPDRATAREDQPLGRHEPAAGPGCAGHRSRPQCCEYAAEHCAGAVGARWPPRVTTTT